jgi:hypothetical protein
MGPTFYDSNPDPTIGNVVNRLGEGCQPGDSPCYFLVRSSLNWMFWIGRFFDCSPSFSVTRLQQPC